MVPSIVRHPENADQGLHCRSGQKHNVVLGVAKGREVMSLGLILIIILIIFLLGGLVAASAATVMALVTAASVSSASS